MREKRKKRGNTILLVLAISMILVLTAGVTVTSILNTTRLNHGSKIIDDLVYASESGLELGIGEVRSGNLVFNESKKTDGTRFDGILKTDVVDRVDISSTKISDTEYELESIAYSKRNTNVFKKVKTKIQKNNISNSINPSGDIMKNGLGVGTGNIAITGNNGAYVDLGSTNVNSPNDIDLSGNNVNSKPPKEENVNKQQYNKLQIDNSKIEHKDKVEVSSFSQLLTEAKDITSGIKANNGIGKIIFNGKMNGGSSHTYTVLIINAKELVIKNVVPEMLNTTAILTNADILLDGVAVHAVDSTIFGNKIKIANGGSLTINGSFQHTPTYGAGWGISEDSMKELSNVIKQYITNWGAPSTGGGSNNGSGSTSSDFEFVDGTFEYE